MKLEEKDMAKKVEEAVSMLIDAKGENEEEEIKESVEGIKQMAYIDRRKIITRKDRSKMMFYLVKTLKKRVDRTMMRKEERDEVLKMLQILEVTMTSLAAGSKDNKITIDGEEREEIEESIRIGANIDSGMAKRILGSAIAALRKKNKKEIKLFDEGNFEINDDKIIFHY